MSLAAPADLLLPEARVRTRRLPPRWMSWATGLFLLASAVGVFLHRSLMADAIRDAKSVAARSWVLIVALVICHRLLLVSQQWAAVPHVQFSRMGLATEANLGASNAVVGGSAIGTALRVAMWRSWGVDPLGAAVALFLTALCPSFAMWIIAGAHAWPDLVAGRADRADLLVGLGAIGFLVVPAVFWAMALTRPAVTAWIGGGVQRVVERVGRRIPAVGRAVAHHPIPAMSEDFRSQALAVCRRRGALILGSAIASQAVLAALLVACLHAVGASGSLDGWEVVRAFALVRVVSSFVPIPGGIGVMELGIVGALTSAGATRPQAIAALAIYRGFTFFLPIVTGACGALIWRRRQIVRGPLHSRSLIR